MIGMKQYVEGLNITDKIPGETELEYYNRVMSWIIRAVSERLELSRSSEETLQIIRNLCETCRRAEKILDSTKI